MSATAATSRFNALPAGEARAELLECCASGAWADAVLAARPFTSLADALAASDEAFARLTADDVDAALADHPRIGERAAGEGRSAQWSRSEQSSVQGADGDTAALLRELNAAYEQRFDRVFLIRAAGRSPEEMAAECRRRLGNDDATETGEVREQLRQITALRLERMLGP
jgi:2-oxo-4-hydroxy-4-carboxy-5-ureidoimidazoline decarboxylase